MSIAGHRPIAAQASATHRGAQNTARRVTPPLAQSRETHLCRRPRETQLQRFRPQSQVTENLADCERVGDLRDHVPPSAAPRAAQDSVPWALRRRLASDQGLCRDVASAFLRAVFASYRRRARAEGVLDAAIVGDEDGSGNSALRARAHPGAVNFVQRFGSSLALDGAAQYLA